MGGTGPGRSGNLMKVTWLERGTDPMGTHPFCVSRGSGEGKKKKKEDSEVKGKFFHLCSGHFPLFSFPDPFLSSFYD